MRRRLASNPDKDWRVQPGLHGAVYVAPDSCDAFPADFWGEVDVAAVENHLRTIEQTSDEELRSLLSALGGCGVELAQQIGL